MRLIALLRTSIRSLLAAGWLLLGAIAPAAPAPATVNEVFSAAPTLAEVEYYTRPLIRARLRIPDSLQGFVVTLVSPMADDAARFEVEVRFRARTPFGGITGHSARFRMKRAASPGLWVVTAE